MVGWMLTHVQVTDPVVVTSLYSRLLHVFIKHLDKVPKEKK